MSSVLRAPYFVNYIPKVAYIITCRSVNHSIETCLFIYVIACILHNVYEFQNDCDRIKQTESWGLIVKKFTICVREANERSEGPSNVFACERMSVKSEYYYNVDLLIN